MLPNILQIGGILFGSLVKDLLPRHILAALRLLCFFALELGQVGIRFWISEQRKLAWWPGLGGTIPKSPYVPSLDFWRRPRRRYPRRHGMGAAIFGICPAIPWQGDYERRGRWERGWNPLCWWVLVTPCEGRGLMGVRAVFGVVGVHVGMGLVRMVMWIEGMGSHVGV